MRYLVLACDYDGTLATDGQIDAQTVAALEQLVESGRRLVMVTGRELDDLQQVCPYLDLFDWIVAENGALLYHPATRREQSLGPAPTELFLQMLKQRGVGPISVGRVIVATWHPHENTVLEVIRDLGLELQVIFNKGAVMILPSGINKATGLKAALKELKMSAHNVVAVGDAENDHAFLAASECGVAVENALPMLKERADWVTAADHGAGVRQLIQALVDHDLAELEPQLSRHYLQLGVGEDGQPSMISPYRKNILITGTSGGGKSTLATGLIERLTQQQYQFCVIDPEGDYSELPGALALGKKQQLPSVEEVIALLDDVSNNCVVSLIGIAFNDRPAFFARLMAQLQDLRTRTGHPHWLIVDEAHHVLPASWEPSKLALPQQFDRTLMITLEPDRVARAALKDVETVIAVGEHPDGTLNAFAKAVELAEPHVMVTELEIGQVLVWHRNQAPFRMIVTPSQIERRRHSRKYVEGEMEPSRSFYFRGPEQKLNLRAHNLIVFLQLAVGIDAETWLYHLRRGDYSCWFRECIKDPDLADEAARIEELQHLSAEASREQIKALIEEHYTLPAAGPEQPAIAASAAQ